MTAPAMEPIDALRRRQFIRLSGASLAALATGCRSPKDPALARGNTVIVGVPDTGNLNPMPAFDQELWLAFLPLVVLNDKGEWEGRLAERWEHSLDYREWTYHIRRGVRWHDGVPVTAHDVKFSLELLAHPDVAEFGPDAFEAMKETLAMVITTNIPTVHGPGRVALWPRTGSQRVRHAGRIGAVGGARSRAGCRHREARDQRHGRPLTSALSVSEDRRIYG